MAAYYEIPCPNPKCGVPNDINNLVCQSCGHSLGGTVNTRRATIPAEISALELRYKDAQDFSVSNSLVPEVKMLETAINVDGKAVINTSVDFLWEWLVKKTADYKSYKRQIIESSRSKAKYADDVNRSITDSTLFGSEIDIIYSALSIDEIGLISYGQATVILKSSAIESRTSALECNSYSFIGWAKNNGWTIYKPLPPGFMSVWESNHKLAAAKLTKSLKSGMSGAEIARLILTSTGDRKTDNFIELHIFGNIASSVVEKIKIPTTLKSTLTTKLRLRLNELEKKVRIEYY